MPIMKRGRLSSARPKRTLLSIDKNYARRIETLYRKAFEAPRVITDEATRDRCRLAVIQELDGVCSVFLTHNDESWPPSRDQLNVGNSHVLVMQILTRSVEVRGAEAGTL